MFLEESKGLLLDKRKESRKQKTGTHATIHDNLKKEIPDSKETFSRKKHLYFSREAFGNQNVERGGKQMAFETTTTVLGAETRYQLAPEAKSIHCGTMDLLKQTVAISN